MQMSHSDVNECGNNNGGCTHKCVNTAGGHQCECPNGLIGCYGGEHIFCYDIVTYYCHSILRSQLYGIHTNYVHRTPVMFK